MGSNEGIVPSEDEITVMVTGFAPFTAESPKNPAWEITRRLPPFLIPSEPLEKVGEPSHEQLHVPKIKILIYPDPIKVAYKTVRELVPRLWDHAAAQAEDGNTAGKAKGLDYMIHVGMASGRRYYSIERKGHRQGYKMKDVDGKILEDDGGRKHKRKGQETTDPVNQHDQSQEEQKKPNTHSTGVEGWIKDVGKSGDSIEEVVRSQINNDIGSAESPSGKPQTVMTGKESSGTDDKRQKTPQEVQESKASTRQPDAPSEAWMRQAAHYNSQRTATTSTSRFDSVEVGDLEEKWIWEGLPKEIETDLDIDDVWKRWSTALPNTDARISEDAGRYLCDFIYYSSLAELTKRDERKRVLFLHVPMGVDEENIAKGVAITSELIRAIVTSDIAKRTSRH